MKKEHFSRRKHVISKQKYMIVFESKAVTLKSIYRKKLKDGRYNVHLWFYEANEISRLCLGNMENIAWSKGMKRGDLITIHLGNGGYICVEKGNNVPKAGRVKYCIV